MLHALLMIGLILALPARAETAAGTVQFCWATGAFDETVYHAEALEREDRSSNFADLLEISGIDHRGVRCERLAVSEHRSVKLARLREWRDAELEVIDTTFMSDLDY